MKANEIKVGECYRSETNWIRYVEAIEDGKVKYRSRDGVFTGDWTRTGSLQWQKLQMLFEASLPLTLRVRMRGSNC
jgi:hypothetical protein